MIHRAATGPKRPDQMQREAPREPSMKNLGNSNEWLSVTLASLGEAIITTDVHGRATFLNPAAAALTGWTHEQAISHPLERVFQITRGATGKASEDPTLRAIRDSTPADLDNGTLLTARDGSQRSIEGCAGPLRDAHQKCIGAALLFRDVTERTKGEESQQFS